MGKIDKSSMEQLFDDLNIPAEPRHTPVDETKPISPLKTKTERSSRTPKTSKAKVNFLVRLSEDNLQKTRILAKSKRFAISDIIDYALTDFISKYEKKNGEIKNEDVHSVADLLK